MEADRTYEQIIGLQRRIAVLEKANKQLRDAVELTVRTMDLHKDPEANPLAKMIGRSRSEAALREALET
jgi:hypothetical protein